MSAANVLARRSPAPWRRKFRRAFIPYLFLAPFFITFLAFWLGPIIASFLYSFTDWRGVLDAQFIGTANYERIYNDPRFWLALRNTAFYGLVYVTLLNVLALALALALDSTWLRFKNGLKIGFFLPVTISLVVAAVIFEMVFANGVGLLNIILGALGLPQPDWLGDPEVAIWSIIILRVWRALGYYAVIYFAGLQAIPGDVKEAARLDGCRPWQVTWYMTLPLLKPVILFGVIMSTIWALELFDEPWVLTKGGPADSTLTIVIYLYQAGFQYIELGYAAAVSYVLTFLIVVAAIVQKLLIGREQQ
ncbi:carbohydrate ABC transporter permease [Microvirga mediterraneensis]|uniref:Sugar ABC transporter permease n=1 Tax=Microvirga mediterraneensis TaxID=2754695 RepID=A0A838BTY5_9HYPH|nr:sugar ABC transporter permease [Microvirga mediterraneensis]MBA1158373.1 sugar ABC transporter permease [Microvirga mediterraneensis]